MVAINEFVNRKQKATLKLYYTQSHGLADARASHDSPKKHTMCDMLVKANSTVIPKGGMPLLISCLDGMVIRMR